MVFVFFEKINLFQDAYRLSMKQDAREEYMAFNFEKFTKAGGRYGAFVSIRKNGAIGLSQGTIRRFAFDKDNVAVILFFDREAKVIGIKPTKNPDDEGAIKVLLKKLPAADGEESTTAFVSARSFLEYYEISYHKKRVFPAKWSDAEGMILIDLSDDDKLKAG